VVATARGNDRHPNARVILEFHEAQGRFYAGGPEAPLRAKLTDDVTWHVPGRSAIAGTYRGMEEVLRYFAARRDLSRATFRIEIHDVLANDERAVILAGGQAERDGKRLVWETVGVFRVAGGKIEEGSLLPFDQYVFDEIWS
jgi:uncharacterized protein